MHLPSLIEGHGMGMTAAHVTALPVSILEKVPEESTILKFCHRLERHGLT